MTNQQKALAVPDRSKNLRVVQWAPGTVGASSLRAIIRHPHLELVGVYVYSKEKEGKDAGELCGLDPVGVLATRNIDDIIALRPDCVLYMPQGTDFDDICALLAAGINIVTTRSDFFFPARMDPELYERVEGACREGGVSIHGTGISPGFITEAFPLALLSVSRQLNGLLIDEYANITDSCSDDLIFDFMGYGKADGKVDQLMLDYTSGGFGNSLALIADAVGLPIDSIESTGETAAARSRVQTPGGGIIEPGTVGALRITVTAFRNGRPLIRFRANWYCTLDIEADWQLQESGWRIQVDSDAPFDINIRFPETDEPFAVRMAGYTAHRAVNAVHYVCAAAPGICSSVDLPQIIARLSGD